MARVAWQFEDPVTSAVYNWPVNPLEGGSPSYRRKISHQSTLAADGDPLVFEGQADPKELPFSGTLLSREQYEAFVVWWKKKYPIRIVDHHGRTFDVVFVDWEPTQVRSASRPYKHTYRANCLVLAMVDFDELV